MITYVIANTDVSRRRPCIIIIVIFTHARSAAPEVAVAVACPEVRNGEPSGRPVSMLTPLRQPALGESGHTAIVLPMTSCTEGNMKLLIWRAY